MSDVFKSGAFVQQCFAVHARCLTLKRLQLPELVVLVCTSCNLLHRLIVRSFAVRVSAMVQTAEELAPGQAARSAADSLAECAAAHPAALSVSAMDVAREEVRLRCAQCRRLYDLDVSTFETHQR